MAATSIFRFLGICCNGRMHMRASLDSLPLKFAVYVAAIFDRHVFNVKYTVLPGLPRDKRNNVIGSFIKFLVFLA